MAVIIRGTTPTVRIQFSSVTATTIVRAYLVVKQNGTEIIRKDMNDEEFYLDTDTNQLTWRMNQADTLSLLPKGKVQIVCDWVLTDGTRGRSRFAEYGVENSGTDEVIISA